MSLRKRTAYRTNAFRELGPWPHPAPLVRELGPCWMACAQVLPWQDTDARLRYMVYSSTYGGTLLLCQFRLFDAARWWHPGMQVGVSGVTHWRLAQSADEDFAELVGPLPVGRPRTLPWLRLRRWWVDYCRYYLRRDTHKLT